ncbi:hypothetical protein E2562_036931 [Oryza meyeriana var. granulata]|uniref:Uncharacterized protein n=1 Tax=Oryza meyeriana var. granulata TaxID=110450 RepID=A0A6G1FG80_9ORYZ|nr:hypothetical protein E2562_036931 [Oryza meyeriana var. granulata]
MSRVSRTVTVVAPSPPTGTATHLEEDKDNTAHLVPPDLGEARSSSRVEETAAGAWRQRRWQLARLGAEKELMLKGDAQGWRRRSQQLNLATMRLGVIRRCNSRHSQCANHVLHKCSVPLPHYSKHHIWPQKPYNPVYPLGDHPGCLPH